MTGFNQAKTVEDRAERPQGMGKKGEIVTVMGSGHVIAGLRGKVSATVKEFPVGPQKAKFAVAWANKAADAAAILKIELFGNPLMIHAAKLLESVQKAAWNMLHMRQEVGEEQARLLAEGTGRAEAEIQEMAQALNEAADELKKQNITVPPEITETKNYFKFLADEMTAARKTRTHQEQKLAE